MQAVYPGILLPGRIHAAAVIHVTAGDRVQAGLVRRQQAAVFKCQHLSGVQQADAGLGAQRFPVALQPVGMHEPLPGLAFTGEQPPEIRAVFPVGCLIAGGTVHFAVQAGSLLYEQHFLPRFRVDQRACKARGVSAQNHGFGRCEDGYTYLLHLGCLPPSIHDNMLA